MNSPHPNHYLSGEVQEIMGKAPSWLTTWAVAILIGVVIILTLVAIFFTYPDKVKGKISLTTAEPPVTVIAPNTGHIALIKVKEGFVVQPNDILAVFATDADVDDIIQLEKQVDELSNFEVGAISAFVPNARLSLGELTPSYTNFLNAFQNLPFVANNAADQAALAVQYGKVSTLQNSVEGLNRKKTKLIQKRDAAQTNLNVSRQLYEQTTEEKYSAEMTKANNELAGFEVEIEQLAAELSRAKSEVLNQNASIFELNILQQAGAKERIQQMKQSLSSLKIEIQNWKEKYLVLSPADGAVAFNTGLAEKQLVNKGEELMFIVPKTARLEYVGEVKIPSAGSGKVKEGQPVVISFDRFNFREFGKVRGKVEKVFTLPQEDGYLVQVSLPKGLTTTLGKTLDFQQKMTGTVEIFTDERRLISRLFDAWRLND